MKEEHDSNTKKQHHKGHYTNKCAPFTKSCTRKRSVIIPKLMFSFLPRVMIDLLSNQLPLTVHNLYCITLVPS